MRIACIRRGRMLELKDITKGYPSGDSAVHALKGISVTFRDREFVSILGQSGCGKTTLLNIIGGLDQYTAGDLVINGRSTKSYKDKDWDTYRNHSVGFVFQSYNLIPHQSVLKNVEMALLLSGVDAQERRDRATAALERVGLADHVNKRPNQLSGGQMQRVAIARAIVNDSEIILADEPTGALDTETSVEVMDILKELSRDRLVVMVTHNPQLAEEYSDRIVRIKDGVLTNDSDPCEGADAVLDNKACEEHARQDASKGKRRMSYPSAIALSFTNLMTKKGRTLLTAFAGSIGIIGIALILSLSDGTQQYIARTERSTMGDFPLTIQETSVDMSSLMSSMMGTSDKKAKPNKTGKVESKNLVNDMVTSMAGGATKNDMRAVKKWVKSNPEGLNDLATQVQYVYSTPIDVYKADTSNGLVQVNPQTVLDAMGISTSGSMQTEMLSSMSASGAGSYDVWKELLDNKKTWKHDYHVVAGHMPRAWNELVVYVDKNCRISDYTLYALGMLDQSDLKGMMSDVVAGKDVKTTKKQTYTYDDLLNLSFKVLPETAKYQKEGDLWTDISNDDTAMTKVVNGGETLKVVGIVRPSDSVEHSDSFGGVLYSPELTCHMISEVDASEVVAAQKAARDTDIMTGLPFQDTDKKLTMDGINQMIAKMPATTAQQMQAYIAQMRAQGAGDDQIVNSFQKLMESKTDSATYKGNLKKLGVADLDEPYAINIYPKDFEAKEQIDDIIERHNDKLKRAGREDDEIHYVDVVGAMMSSVTDIVNSITYILVAFVAISLVVSSIMIGIITYISVLERTKEIGILRAIGASKRDISRVFNAETFIIGLVAGVLGVGVTALLDIPINMVIEHVAGVANLAAVPVGAGIALVGISVVLTLIGGLIPAKIAAKKDPVTALRTE